jgi:hypothetical protein
VRCSDAVSVIAAELGIFSLEADAQGNYAARTEGGVEIRLITVSDEKLLVEGVLLGGIYSLVRSPEALLPVLRHNFVRSILEDSTLTYQRDRDELVLVATIAVGKMDEDAVGNRVETFLSELAALGAAVRQMLQPSPMGSMPVNPASITK